MFGTEAGLAIGLVLSTTTERESRFPVDLGPSSGIDSLET